MDPAGPGCGVVYLVGRGLLHHPARSGIRLRAYTAEVTPLQGSIRRILVMVDVSRLKALARDIAKLKKFVPKRCQPDQPAKNQAHQHRGTAQILGLF